MSYFEKLTYDVILSFSEESQYLDLRYYFILLVNIMMFTTDSFEKRAAVLALRLIIIASFESRLNAAVRPIATAAVFGYSTARDLGFWNYSIFGSPDAGISQAVFSFG